MPPQLLDSVSTDGNTHAFRVPEEETACDLRPKGYDTNRRDVVREAAKELDVVVPLMTAFSFILR